MWSQLSSKSVVKIKLILLYIYNQITFQKPRIFQRSFSKIKWKQMWNNKLLSNLVTECAKNCVALDWCKNIYDEKVLLF